MFLLLLKILIEIITPGSRVLLEKVTIPQLIKKFPAFYETQRFIAAFARAKSIQSMSPSHVLKISSNIILPPTPRISKWFFLSVLPNWILYAPLMSHINATFPSYFILLDLIIRIIVGEQYTSLSSALCILIHFPATSFFAGRNTYSRTPSAYVSPSMRSAKFHTHTKQRDKIIVLCMLILKVWIANWKTEDFVPNDGKHSVASVLS